MNAQRTSEGLRRGQKQQGFTLIEMLITLSIIALLASIAIPYFVTYRTAAYAKACVSNMRSIYYAKEQWALEMHKGNGDPCNITDLVGTSAYIKNMITCPTGPAYLVEPVGDKPKCPSGLTDHELP